MHQRNVKIFIFVFLASLAGLFYLDPSRTGHYPWIPESPQPQVAIPVPPPKPSIPSISNKTPSYQDYPKIVAQLAEWNQEAPDLIDIGTYGKTAKGLDVHYIKITNEFDNSPKPVVLITACIHGNEPHSTSTMMAFFGTFISRYGTDEQVTQLIDERIIYFVPVVSPDSYPGSRHVNGVDPNRNFPGLKNPNIVSVPPVKLIQDFFMKIRPQAVISGHTWGRVFLIPYGDKRELCPDDFEYREVMGRVSELCQYRLIRTCEMYGKPIFGTEVDWYYRHGAFAVVMEIGTHQKIPNDAEIMSEMNRVYEGLLYFIDAAPVVNLDMP